jgi:methylated-DNA-protein-cysteine methyltransferase-like protein
MKTFNEKVYDTVRKIPKGKVMNYGQIAALLENPVASRAVGYALCRIKSLDDVPAQRVVYKDGSLSQTWANEQTKLLKSEGISFLKNKKVNMKKHQLK